MPQNLSRDEDNARRKQRLEKVKRGPGIFVYDGSLCDTKWTPTYKLVGTNEAVYTAAGAPLVDKAGRQIYAPTGEIARDEIGSPILGGIPVQEKIAKDSWSIRGVTFHKGVPVEVADPDLARKLRCMDGFVEADQAALDSYIKQTENPDDLTDDEAASLAENEGEPVVAKKRGRPAKSREAVAD